LKTTITKSSRHLSSSFNPSPATLSNQKPISSSNPQSSRTSWPPPSLQINQAHPTTKRPRSRCLSCTDLIKPNHSKNGSFGDEQLTAVPKFLEAKGENLTDSREIHKIYWHACPALILLSTSWASNELGDCFSLTTVVENS
jgi:hypothetical protein